MENSASLSGSIGESTICAQVARASAFGWDGQSFVQARTLQMRFSPRPLRSARRVVEACAMMLPPIACAQKPAPIRTVVSRREFCRPAHLECRASEHASSLNIGDDLVGEDHGAAELVRKLLQLAQELAQLLLPTGQLAPTHELVAE